MRVNWLCQCGTGRLAVEVDDVPLDCPTCGHTIRFPDDDFPSWTEAYSKMEDFEGFQDHDTSMND